MAIVLSDVRFWGKSGVGNGMLAISSVQFQANVRLVGPAPRWRILLHGRRN